MSIVWPNRSWSVCVRQHYEEALYFFRLSLSKLNLDTFKERLAQVGNNQKVRGLNAYIVFGPYDIVIRVWLPTHAVEAFAQQVYLHLGLEHTPDHFQVVFPKVEPTAQEQGHLEILDDWSIVKRIQEDQAPDLLNELIELKMVEVQHDSRPQAIRFLITIGEGHSHIREDKLKKVRSEIEGRLRDSKVFLSWNVYTGKGICPVLLEAEVPVGSYYEIGSLTKFFLDEYGPDGLHSQSYLFVNHEPLLRGYDIIDDRTLLEHRSKESVVRRFCARLRRTDPAIRRSDRFSDVE